MGARMIAGDAGDALAGASDEGDAGAAPAHLAHEVEAEAGGAAGDGNAEIVQVWSGCIVHIAILWRVHDAAPLYKLK
jgi:hypothetical protein